MSPALAGGFFATSATWEALVLWLRSVNMLVSEIFGLVWLRRKKPVNPKGNQSWIFNGRTDTETETPILGHLTQRINATHWKRPWCWERLKAGGEGDDRGWDGWIASLTRWTRVWASYGSCWWTGEPGIPQSMGLQRVGHDWVTELSWVKYLYKIKVYIIQWDFCESCSFTDLFLTETVNLPNNSSF